MKLFPFAGIAKKDFPKKSSPTSRLDWLLVEIGLPILLGLVVGGGIVVARELPSNWSKAVLLAIFAPPIVLLVRDLRKLFLVVLVVDIPLGFDVSLAEQANHKGGPSGFLISLMSMVLVVGYGMWIANRNRRQESRDIPHKPLTAAALLFIFFMFLSFFQSTVIRLSITQMFFELQLFLMYLYVAHHVTDWASMHLVARTLIICLLLESMLIIAQYFFGFQFSFATIQSRAIGSNIASSAIRAGGTLGTPNAAATFLASLLPLAFTAFLTKNWLIDRRIALVAFLAGMVALIATQSRSGWTAFAIALLLVILQALRKQIGLKAIAVMIVIMVLVGVAFSGQIQERFTADDKGSAESRIWLAEWAFNIIEHHMFTGIGLNNTWILALHRKYLPLELVGKRILYVVHNKYLMVWVETGLFGLLAFAGMLLTAVWRALKTLLVAQNGRVSLLVTSLLAGLSVNLIHMFSATFTSRSRLQLVWLLLGLIVAVSYLNQIPENPAPESEARLSSPSL